LDYVHEAKNKNPNVSVQEEYHLPHVPLDGNCDLSYPQSDSNVDNEFNYRFDEPPLDAHGDFIQYGHGENVTMGSQQPHPIYTNMKEECQNGIKKSDDKSYYFKLNFQAIDFLYRLEFNEEEVFLALE
jgi:hypothetical protein